MTGLIPDKEYKFRVTAVNAEGESDPLSMDHSVLIKNPFGKSKFSQHETFSHELSSGTFVFPVFEFALNLFSICNIYSKREFEHI